MSNNVVDFIVRVNGAIDQEATLNKFSAALAEYSAKRETEEADISAAVNAVFDKYPGASVNLPALSNLACANLKVSASSHAAMTERVADFVRANAGEGGAFEIRKGKGGGVSRRADKAPATAAE
jgi:hypothetical protein